MKNGIKKCFCSCINVDIDLCEREAENTRKEYLIKVFVKHRSRPCRTILMHLFIITVERYNS